MTDRFEALRIAEFEHVAAGSSLTLLRVSGKLPPTGNASAQRPALVAAYRGELQRFEALPSPPDPPGVVRAAYSVPAALVAPDTSYTLELGDGANVTLPTPAPGTARRSGPAPVLARGRDTTGVHTRRDGAEEVAALSAALAEAREHARRLEDENERLSATLAELDVWRGELERRLADTTDQLAEARSRLAAAEVEALSTRAEAAATAQAARELAEAVAADQSPR
ncbi:MAG: hypothetical protein ACJ780_05875 [Solirubrobacteraceae bacterium]